MPDLLHSFIQSSKQQYWGFPGGAVVEGPPVTESKLALPAARQANESERWGVEARKDFNQGSLADWEDGRLSPQHSCLGRAWLPGSFVDQIHKRWVHKRWITSREVRKQSRKTFQSLQMSPRMASLKHENVFILLPLVQFSRSVMSDSLWPHGLQPSRLPCPSPTPGACSSSCPSSRWCHPTLSSSVVPFCLSLPYSPSQVGSSGYLPEAGHYVCLQ